MEDDRPTAGRVDEDEAAEDAPADWSKLSYHRDGTSHVIPFIPKRGEKDFEPIPPSDFPTSTNEALLSQHQINTLAQSRSALFTALASGSRHHSSRASNSFTWRPEVDGGRASLDGASTYGVHFSTVGSFNAQRRRLELLPEEALYLAERGTIELWTETVGEGGELLRVPMSVQQAWAAIIGHDELTLERFNVYAQLKRLGYVLVRSRTPQPTVIRPVKTTVAPRTAAQLFRLPFETLHQAFLQLFRSLLNIPRLFAASPIMLGVTRTLHAGEGRLRSLIGAGRWTSYDQIFARLQIVPSGWDTPLPRGPLPKTPSVLTPLHPTSAPSSDLPSLEDFPYQTFYNIYKPVTKFRKSAPPPPDFEIVVINAVTTPLPDLFEFGSMFDSAPSPPGDTLLPPPRPIRAGPPLPASQARKPAPPRFVRAPPPPPTRMAKVLSYLPFGLAPKVQNGRPAKPKNAKPSPYPRLKIGRRSIIVAVVDNGTTSYIRFSESEFAKLQWAGNGRKA
ncbi:tRNA-splicing endonuclease subunit Sen54, partial [Phenoliferia sp. Uapishka_3]